MIDVRNVSKVYSTGSTLTQVLFDITFKIEKGEFVAIVGPSGSGKSTLMHILGALDVPSSGDYFLNGKSIITTDDDELADIRNNQIGFIFQAYNLLPRMSAVRNVSLPMMYAGVPEKLRHTKALEALRVVDLIDKANNKPNQLSGGQKQRVAIARALTMNPSIILADEPTGNLPTQQSNEIINVLQNLNKQGHTIVLITHNDDIARRAHRVLSIVDGRIVKDTKNEKN